MVHTECFGSPEYYPWSDRSNLEVYRIRCSKRVRELLNYDVKIHHEWIEEDPDSRCPTL